MGISNDLQPSVEYEDVDSDSGNLNKNVYQKEIGKVGLKFTKENILYGKLRPYLHHWLNSDIDGIATGDWWVLKPNNVIKEFLYLLIQTNRFDSVANQSTGSKMPRADWKLVSDAHFYVPLSFAEQNKIFNVNQMLDIIITLHQRNNLFRLYSDKCIY